MTRYEIEARVRAAVNEFMAPHVAELNAAIDELESQVRGNGGAFELHEKQLDNHERAITGCVEIVEDLADIRAGRSPSRSSDSGPLAWQEKLLWCERIPQSDGTIRSRKTPYEPWEVPVEPEGDAS